MDNEMTVEEVDEAEELRFLALKSMVRRSKQTNAIEKPDEVNDNDILLLRAAALKTITHKNNTQSSSLGNKNEKKRTRNAQTSPQISRKNIKLNENKLNEISKYLTKPNNPKESDFGILKHDSERQYKCKPKLEVNSIPQNKSVVAKNGEVKKIVRNGSIQLSNLDSEQIDETMVLHITFSSSESDDSSSECDTPKNNVTIPNNKVFNINSDSIRSNVPTKNIVNNHVQTLEPKYIEDNKLRINSCMQKICVLMRNCESEIEKRNQQLDILLKAYENYQNHSKSLFSILEAMKRVREELSIYTT